jgi:hypothetical protein
LPASAEIRPFTRADIAEVGRLSRAHISGWSLDDGLLAGLMLDDPWADPELPSLVAVDDTGRIIGFTGVQVRRVRFAGESIRAVHSGHGVVEPDRRGGATGAMLIGRVLSGPQAFTWSDGTIDAVAAIFRAYGGHIDHVRSCDWVLGLRPARWLLSVITGSAAQARSEHASRRALVPVGGFPLQSLGRRVFRSAFPGPFPGVTGEDADAAAIVEHLSFINKDKRLWIDHDEAHLEHMFGLVRAFGGLESFKGTLHCRLVRRNGQAVGWYALLLRHGGASRVLHLTARERDADAVLDELVAHATELGSAALAGRAEPHLQRALTQRFALLGYARQPTIHAKDPALLATLATQASVVTRIDGDVFSV